jgi:methionine aminopeptidase
VWAICIFWTNLTAFSLKDGGLSAQWEHMVLVTPEGSEVLTLRPGEVPLPPYGS